MGEFSAYHANSERTFFVQRGDDIAYMVSFSFIDEKHERVNMRVKVTAADTFEAIAKAAPVAKREYPTAYGKLKSEKFLEYAQILVSKIHD